MTENNSDFAPEPSVGNAIEVSQEIKETNPPVEDSKCENYYNCNDSPKELDLIENNETQVTAEMATSLACVEKLNSLQDHWLKLSTFFRKVYHTILDGEKPPDKYECHMDVVKELVAYDPHQLFARLEMDLQEFVIEVKLRQMELLNCVHTDEGPHLFIFCLIEGYNKLMFAADTLSPLLTQLEAEHLAKFNITWRGLNQHLFHKLVFTEPKIQKILPFCISKLGKMNSELSDFNKRLIRQFLTFDDEMTKIGGKWREAESAIIKYHQENSMLDAKERMMKVNWELIKTQTKVFHEELKSSGFCDNYFSESLKKIKSEMENSLDQAICECCHLSTTQCLINSVPISLESFVEAKSLNNCSSHCDSSDAEILSHLNADGKKMYSHLHKFKAQQQQQLQQKHQQQLAANGAKSVLSSPPNAIKSTAETTASNVEQNTPKPATDFNVEQSALRSATGLNAEQSTLTSTPGFTVEQSVLKSTPGCNSEQGVLRPAPQHKPNPPPITSSIEMHKSLIRKQQHQKKIMQMMQSSQQKDIHHKIQKQLQEHQLLLQQERKIDELQAYLLQKHPHLDKEMQKKVNLQMQHRLMQKHKQMEEKFHQQVQHHMQHHQEKPPPTMAAKLNGIQKTTSTANQSSIPNCNHAKPSVTSPKGNNHKCAGTPPLGHNHTTNSNIPTTVPPAGTAAKSTVSNGAGGKVTHKNSTTQTNAASAAGQNRVRHNPLPDVVKSASYICMKHSEGNKPDPNIELNDFGVLLYSSGNSSDEDDCSERSNSPQRHCDCCYCEVFGSAPVNRNFQETRERLRLILTKKKAKSNSVAANNDKQPSAQNSIAAPSNFANPAQPASQCVKAKKDDVAAASTDKKTKPVVSEYKGDKSIEEILDFIEGNKNGNVKRTAKKMRRKQRQLEEEERRRKEEEEAERLRQEEIRRKEEEEKRRIEEERRRQELLKEQNRKKNKKKNSRQNQQLNALLASQQSNKKNKKNSPQTQSNDKSKPAQNQPNKNANQKQNQQQQNKPTNQQQSKKGKPEPVPVKQQAGKQKGQQEKQKAQQPAKNASTSQKKTTPSNQQKTGKNGDPEQPQMVTIKRVMQPNSSEPTVTITLRGSTPKEDKVLYTLLNGQMCPLKEEKGKKQTPSGGNNNVNNKKSPNKPSVTLTNTYNNNTNNYNHMSNSNPNPANMLPKQSIPFNKSCSIVGNGVNSITERIERLKLGQLTMPSEPVQKMISAPTATQAELTTPTAIQINQAVNQLSSRPTFPNSFDLENIKLPPGITITKVDPASVNRKPIQQMKQQAPPPPPPQAHIRQTMMSPMAGSSNVIVVDTGEKNNYYQSEDQNVNGMKKKRRRRKKDNGDINQTNMTNVHSQFGAPNGLPSRMGPVNASMYGNPFMSNDYHRNVPQQPAAIIQMNGSMVTIRNPALHQALAGQQQMDYHDGMRPDFRNSNSDETMFSPVPEEIENGDVDEYERELEAFKRFCSQSVPAESKAKVNLNLEDIVLKKKGPVIGCS